MTRPLLPVAPDVGARLSGTPLLVMLDVDGTLAPIAERPEEAAVPPGTRRVVAALAALPGVNVAFVSGRAASDVMRLTDVRGAWVIGNHGFEIVPPGADAGSIAPLGEQREVAAATRELGAATAGMAGVIVEDKRYTSSVHFRLADPAIVDALRTIVARVANRHGLRVVEGKKVLEVRPHTDVHKGTAAVGLARAVLGARPGGAAVYFGDDTTDEDAFASLRAEVPVAVTARVSDTDDARTSAEFVVRDTDEVRRFLEWLERQRGRPTTAAP